MTACTVLSDSTVREILLDLSRDQIITFLNELENALISFSKADEKALQPNPSVVKRSDGRKTLFRPFSSDAGPGVKIIVDPTTNKASQADESGHQSHPDASKNASAKKPTLHGILALCDRDGLPIGLINAEEITAFRTALSVMIPYQWRSSTENIVVFGAGKVALWHIRLALRLRGPNIKTIAIVNRSMDRSAALVELIQQEDMKRWGFAGELKMLDPEKADHPEELKLSLAAADVVFCTTPSKTALFTAKSLRLGDSERRDPFISAIGSWTADMIELDPNILIQAAQSTEHGSKLSRGLVIVDDREGALEHAGEIVKSGLQSGQMTELGQLSALRHHDGDEFGELSSHHLRNGLVIYKSIGVSMTDLVSGQVLLKFANEKKLGVSLADF